MSSTSVSLNNYFGQQQNTFGLSLDSASRMPGQPLNNYTLKFYEPINRVKSVQLGSMSLPDLARYPFPSNVVIPISEPIGVPPNAGFTIKETTRVTLKTGTKELVQPQPAPTFTTVYLAPSMNKVMYYDAGTDANPVLHFQHAHRLNVVAQFSPPQFSAVFVGTSYVQEWEAATILHYAPIAIGGIPILTPTTQINVLPSPSLDADSTSLQFKPGYLALRSGAATLNGQRFTDNTNPAADPNYWSYLRTTPPTISEVIIILNDMLNDRHTLGTAANYVGSEDGTLQTLVKLRIDDDDGSLVIEAQPYTRTVLTLSGDTATAVTTAELVATPLGEAGGGLILNGMLPALKPCVLYSDTGARFAFATFWQVRQPKITGGAYLAQNITSSISSILSPMTVPIEPPHAPASATNSFVISESGGYTWDVPILAGSYTGAQLAVNLEETLGVEYAVQYTTSADGGVFTISNRQASTFSMDFTQYAPYIAEVFGFNTQVYASGSCYVSSNPIQSVPTIDTTILDNSPEDYSERYTKSNYTCSGDQIMNRFTMQANPPIIVNSREILGTGYWYTISIGSNMSPDFKLIPCVGGRYKAGDVLGVQPLDDVVVGSGVPPTGFTIKFVSQLTVVVKEIWDGTDRPWVGLEPTASITNTSPLYLPDPNVNDRYTLSAVQRQVFQLPFCLPYTCARQLGFSRQMFPVLPQCGQIAVVGAQYTRGNGMYTTSPPQSYAPYNMPSIYLAPFNWDLKAPRYILMSLRFSAQPSARNSHILRKTKFPILAKLLISDSENFYRGFDENAQYTFTDFARLEQVEVAFMYGDGSPVDFNGQNHSFTLLFSTTQGTTDKICL